MVYYKKVCLARSTIPNAALKETETSVGWPVDQVDHARSGMWSRDGESWEALDKVRTRWELVALWTVLIAWRLFLIATLNLKQ